jgi:hypothetical protein
MMGFFICVTSYTRISLRLVLFFGSECSTLTNGGESNVSVFERPAFRAIFGLKREKVNGENDRAMKCINYIMTVMGKIRSVN